MWLLILAIRLYSYSRERRRLCTVQPGWRTFDPNILHAGCTESAGRLIEIEGGLLLSAPPPLLLRGFPAAGPVLALLQMPEIHLIFSVDDIDEIRSLLGA